MAKGVAWWKLLVVGSAVAAGVCLGQLPWRRAWEQQRSLAALREAVRRAEADRERLAREKARLENPLFREAMLREQGLLKAGEKPLTVPLEGSAETR